MRLKYKRPASHYSSRQNVNTQHNERTKTDKTCYHTHQSEVWIHLTEFSHNPEYFSYLEMHEISFVSKSKHLFFCTLFYFLASPWSALSFCHHLNACMKCLSYLTCSLISIFYFTLFQLKFKMYVLFLTSMLHTQDEW